MLQKIGPALRVIHDATELSRPCIGAPTLTLASRDRVPDLSFEGIAERSRRAAAMLARIEALDTADLPAELVLILRMIDFTMRRQSQDSGAYWLVIDPTGLGMYGMFAWTAYNGGMIVNGVAQYARAFGFETASDADRYLAFVSDVAAMIDQLDARTKGQAERGIYMPQVQLDQAVPLLGGFKANLMASLAVKAERFANIEAPHFPRELEHRLEHLIGPAMDGATATLNDEYRRRAPVDVGLSQYPGGREVYETLVRLHTTLDLSAGEVHRMGLERTTGIRAAMADIRREVGFAGDDRAYLETLMNDAAWRAETEGDVARFFQRYIDRLTLKYNDYFDFQSPNPYGVAPLPAALEAAMTFGYYDMPRKGKPSGDYVFNGANLIKTQLSNVAALNYHELVPGHHLHLTVQQSNDAVHPLHNDAFFNAFNEGWAEYAATLAGEAGMYREPAERFGRLVNEAFLTCRLVVDTGMNAFGWSLEQARDYMREHGFFPETEIRSETIRYSCDLPGQALAYKTGDAEIMRLREKMRARLGERFDIKDFHRAMLHPGGMPLPVLEWHLDQVTEALASG